MGLKKLLLVFLFLGMLATPVMGEYWAKTYGTGYPQEPKDIDFLPNGNVVLVGKTYVPWSFYSDAFVMEVSPNGSLVWGEVYGGNLSDWGNAVTVDSEGNLYLAGTTQSFGPTSAWLLKLSPGGRIIWGRVYRGGFLTGFNSVAMAKNGDVIAAGWIDINPKGSTNNEFFVIRLDSFGKVKWANVYETLLPGDAKKVLIDEDGNIFVVGQVGLLNSWNYTLVLKLRPNGSIIWAKLYTEKESSEVSSAVLTKDGGLIVTATSQEAQKALVFRINSNGDLVWAEHYAPIRGGVPHALTLDPNGDIFIGGEANVSGKVIDLWVLALDSSGKVLWSKGYGGKYGEWAMAMTFKNGLWVSGLTLLGMGYGDVLLLHLPKDGRLNWNLSENVSVNISKARLGVKSIRVRAKSLYYLGKNSVVGRFILVPESGWNVKEKTLFQSNTTLPICGPALFLLLLPILLSLRRH